MANSALLGSIPSRRCSAFQEREWWWFKKKWFRLNDFVSTTLYIVTVLRSHLGLPGVSSNVSRLRLIYSFAVLPASNSVFVCVATFIIATRFGGVKQIGFYSNILEQQLVSWCFNFHCCACDVILFHLSASNWCASSAWALTFWFREVWLRNLAVGLGSCWLNLVDLGYFSVWWWMRVSGGSGEGPNYVLHAALADSDRLFKVGC